MTSIRGLPGHLPPGEHILWQSRPTWPSLARHLCHVRPIALYLAIVIAGTAAASILEGDTLLQTLLTTAPFVALAALVLAFLYALAWCVARTTEYTLTTHRLVMRFGVALPATLAIPLRGIARAAVTLHKDQTGDLPLETKPGYEVTYFRAWPHTRPWHLSHPQPMLRSIPRAGELATILARTLAQEQAERRLALSVTNADGVQMGFQTGSALATAD